MAFASLSVEDMAKTFNTVIAAFRTTTILIGREKSPNNLQVMEYMAGLKIMVGLKFKGSMAQVNWKRLDRFIPGASYWIERYAALEDDDERMTVNYMARSKFRKEFMSTGRPSRSRRSTSRWMRSTMHGHTCCSTTRRLGAA